MSQVLVVKFRCRDEFPELDFLLAELASEEKFSIEVENTSVSSEVATILSFTQIGFVFVRVRDKADLAELMIFLKRDGLVLKEVNWQCIVFDEYNLKLVENALAPFGISAIYPMDFDYDKVKQTVEDFLTEPSASSGIKLQVIEKPPEPKSNISQALLVKFRCQDEFPNLDFLLAELASEKKFSIEVENTRVSSEVATILSFAEVGFVFVRVKDKMDLAELMIFLKRDGQVLKDLNWQCIVFDEYNFKIVKNELAPFGITSIYPIDFDYDKVKQTVEDFLSEPSASAGINLPLIENNPESKSNTMNPSKKSPSGTMEQATVKSSSAPKNALPEGLEIVPALNLEADIWLLEDPSHCRRTLGTWVVKILAPSPKVSSWVKVSSGVWEFKVNEEEKEILGVEGGKWFVVAAAVPKINWDEKKWTIQGKEIQLYFQTNDEKQYKLQSSGTSLNCATNSLFAEMKRDIILNTFSEKFIFSSESVQTEDSNLVDETDTNSKELKIELTSSSYENLSGNKGEKTKEKMGELKLKRKLTNDSEEEKEKDKPVSMVVSSRQKDGTPKEVTSDDSPKKGQPFKKGQIDPKTRDRGPRDGSSKEEEDEVEESTDKVPAILQDKNRSSRPKKSDSDSEKEELPQDKLKDKEQSLDKERSQGAQTTQRSIEDRKKKLHEKQQEAKKERTQRLQASVDPLQPRKLKPPVKQNLKSAHARTSQRADSEDESELPESASQEALEEKTSSNREGPEKKDQREKASRSKPDRQQLLKKERPSLKPLEGEEEAEDESLEGPEAEELDESGKKITKRQKIDRVKAERSGLQRAEVSTNPESDELDGDDLSQEEAAPKSRNGLKGSAKNRLRQGRQGSISDEETTDETLPIAKKRTEAKRLSRKMLPKVREGNIDKDLEDLKKLTRLEKEPPSFNVSAVLGEEILSCELVDATESYFYLFSSSPIPSSNSPVSFTINYEVGEEEIPLNFKGWIVDETQTEGGVFQLVRPDTEASQVIVSFFNEIWELARYFEDHFYSSKKR